MSDQRNLFEKIIAVAVNPGAYEQEAISALRRARELVKEHPSLAHPEPKPPKPAPPEDGSFQTEITNITALLLPVLMTNLSIEAYGLGLKSKIEVKFTAGAVLYKLDVRCDGPIPACEAFRAHLDWTIQHFNENPLK